MPDLIAQLDIRPATPRDISDLVRISTGPIAEKRAFISASITRRSVLLAALDGRTVGYIVWDREFFGRHFVWLLGVDPLYRRRGIAAHLLRIFEARTLGEPLFVSTNASNVAMQALLTSLGFVLSGQVDNLDPGDPELFFFKAAVTW